MTYIIIMIIFLHVYAYLLVGEWIISIAYDSGLHKNVLFQSVSLGPASSAQGPKAEWMVAYMYVFEGNLLKLTEELRGQFMSRVERDGGSRVGSRDRIACLKYVYYLVSTSLVSTHAT